MALNLHCSSPTSELTKALFSELEPVARNRIPCWLVLLDPQMVMLLPESVERIKLIQMQQGIIRRGSSQRSNKDGRSLIGEEVRSGQKTSCCNRREKDGKDIEEL